jgi:tetratricopeptide (TPR) repeat protein
LTFSRVNNLGSVLRDLGDLAGARAHLERALRIDEAAYGPNHPTVAFEGNNLGYVLWELGDLAGARTYYERALRIFAAAYGPDHPNTRIVADNLAGLQAHQ